MGYYTTPLVCFLLFGICISSVARFGLKRIQHQWVLCWHVFQAQVLDAIFDFTSRFPKSREKLVREGERLILKKGQVEAMYPRGTWQRQGHEDFVSILLAKEHGAKTFPCIHATKGHRADELHYLFIHSDDPSEPRNVALIATALHGYLHVAKATGFHTSLIIMAPRIDDLARPKSIEDYRQSYWRMCKRLRTFDSKPWPKHIPEDTSSEQWCWCFEGIPSFMAVMTPAHEKRRSRYAPNFCIIYQPKWIFETLYSTAEKREAASKKVRDLIGEFDEIPISLDITHYGEPGSSEARQLFLLDENESSPCPHPSVSSLDSDRV